MTLRHFLKNIVLSVAAAPLLLRMRCELPVVTLEPPFQFGVQVTVYTFERGGQWREMSEAESGIKGLSARVWENKPWPHGMGDCVSKIAVKEESKL